MAPSVCAHAGPRPVQLGPRSRDPRRVPRSGARMVETPALATPSDVPVSRKDDDTEAKAGGCPFHAGVAAIHDMADHVGSRKAGPAEGEGDVPPGPPAFSLESMMDVSKILTHGLHQAMLSFDAKYGPICRFSNPSDLNGASHWVFLNSPENVQHVCHDNVRNYQRRYLPDIYEFATNGKGILGSQGTYNTKHRRMCQPPFRNKNHLKKFSDVVVNRADEVCRIWQQHGSFRTDVSMQTQRLTLDVVGLVAFSHDFGQVARVAEDMEGSWSAAKAESQLKDDQLLWAVNTFGETLANIFITPLPLLRILDRIGFPELKLLNRSIEVMKEEMMALISKRRETIKATGKGPDDLLGALLEMQDDDGTTLTDEELWEDVHDIMGAGHETTATTTAALIYCISKNPEIEAKIAEELKRVCGDRLPDYGDLDDLMELGKALKEVLRLYPAIPVFPREAQAADVLPTGHRVDAGDVVFMSTFALGRSPVLWEDPLKYDPERFSPEGLAKQHRFQWVPFGAGPRMCLGPSWAMMSVTLMAATLLQRFKFTPVRPNTEMLPIEYDITMNYNPTGGLHMQVEPRE